MKLRGLIIAIVCLLAMPFTVWGAEPASKVKAGKLKHEDPKELASFNFSLPAPASLPLLAPVVAENDNSDVISDLLEFAHSHLGTRYRRGGKTPAGFDCSGFTGYVFRQFGVKLGASSSAQAYDGVAVDKSEVQPGDILLFNGRAVGSRVGHVGIAIEQNPVTGEITFIHSANGGGIRIDKTTSPYYARRFVGARRVLGE